MFGILEDGYLGVDDEDGISVISVESRISRVYRGPFYPIRHYFRSQLFCIEFWLAWLEIPALSKVRECWHNLAFEAVHLQYFVLWLA